MMCHGSSMPASDNFLITQGLTAHDLLDALMLFIFLLYLMIARQVYILAKPLIKKRVKGVRSLLYLMFVFAQCGLTGYASRLLGLGIEAIIGMHVILAIVTTLYVFSGQNRILVKALTDD